MSRSLIIRPDALTDIEDARRSFEQIRLGLGDRFVDRVEALLNLVETYEPANTAEVLSRLPHWQVVLRHEIGLASGPKPFFNERVQEMHGGGRDQRRMEDTRTTAKQRELEFLARLQTLLAN